MSRGQGLRHIDGRAVLRLAQTELVHELREALAILGPVDGVRAGADDRDPCLLQAHGKGERSLAPELHDHPVGLLPVHDCKDILPGERLEVQLVGGVVVRGDGLGIRVDHDRLEARLAQRECRVHAAVVELDPLADAVRAAAEDHDLLFLRRPRLVFPVIGRVVVGRVGLELRGAGIHQLVAGDDPLLPAQYANGFLVRTQALRDLRVAEAHALRRQQRVRRDRRLEVHDLFHVGEEPRIDAGGCVQTLHRPAPAQRLRDVEEPLRVRPREHLLQLRVAARRNTHEPHALDLQPPDALLERLLECPADRHDLAHGLHLDRESGIRGGELFECESRDLHHAVVDGRLV